MDLWQALSLQAGYNAALVTIGASLLGACSGAVGSFLYLRKRVLVSDAVAHATLPGIGAAFLIMAASGGDGRTLIGLLLGAAVSATLGLLAVEAMARLTRLGEDVAIGAVLSVFFGVGVVLMTVIQSAGLGTPAGLEGFLLGATASMLWSEAMLITLAAAFAGISILVLSRSVVLVAFDGEYAGVRGVPVHLIDLAIMGLAMIVTVIGLKVVGLVLIVALLIIPAATARFWTDRADHLIAIAALLGAAAGWIGSALSATSPNLPTGPIIVLVAGLLFALAFLFAPRRGVVASMITQRQFQTRVHRRQGLLSLARAEQIFDPTTLRVLRRDGAIRADGVATETGRAQAARALLDEQRFELARRLYPDDPRQVHFDGLTPINQVLTPDEVTALDAAMVKPRGL
ncbi:MAG: metal ABC transporter permease [Pseudomonadota bacterium]